MIKIENDDNGNAKLLVLGIGGCGNNAIDRLLATENKGVDLVAVNTDLQTLDKSKSPQKLQIGKKLTGGKGVGGNPDRGTQAAEESIEEIKELIEDYNMVFITAGMGGGTGTGGAPVVAKLAKEKGILTVAIVTKPFEHEGRVRMRHALKGIEELRKNVDTLIVVSNEKIFDIIDENVTAAKAREKVDEVLQHGVQTISEIIYDVGEINLDFADVTSVMKDKGTAYIGIGNGSGEDRAIKAAQMAINSPLLETSIEGATHLLVNINGGKDMTLYDSRRALNLIRQGANEDVEIFWGETMDESLEDEIIVTLIATGIADGNNENNESDEGINQKEDSELREEEANTNKVEARTAGKRLSTNKDNNDRILILPEFLNRS